MSNPFKIQYYYRLNHDKEKYIQWFRNRYEFNWENYESLIKPFGFYLRKKTPFFTMNHEERFRGQIRGEFKEKESSLLLIIEVLYCSPLPAYIPAIVLAILFVILGGIIAFKNSRDLATTMFGLVFMLSAPLMIYYFIQMEILQGKRMVKELEDLFELTENRIDADNGGGNLL